MKSIRVTPRAMVAATAAGAAAVLGVVLFDGAPTAPDPIAQAALSPAASAQLVTVNAPRTAVRPDQLRAAARSSKARPAKPSKSAAPKAGRIKPGQLAVEFDRKTSERDRAALRRSYGVTKFESPVEGVERWHLAKRGTEQETATKLAAEPGVAVATPNRVITLSAAPNDTRFGEQWFLDQPSGNHDIDAIEGWAASDATATAPVTVAVVDTGVQLDHPDLANQLWRNPGEYGPDGRGGRKENNGRDDDYNEIVDDVNGYTTSNPSLPPTPSEAHGTHVAGIIAAERGNSAGVAGVSKQAKIMSVRAFEGRNTDEVALRKAVQYAVDEGAKVVNGSFGALTTDASQGLLTSVVQANPDVLFVFGAGNEGVELGTGMQAYPCSIPSPNIICVGATDEAGVPVKSWWSTNYGVSEVDIAAPGANILSTVPGSAYAEFGGTSMATPVVAGAAAILRSKEPSLTPPQIRERLMRTADPIPSAVATGSGRVNLANAIADTLSTRGALGTATVKVQSSVLVYTAAAGAPNGVTVTRAGSTYTVTDPTTALTPGAGCTTVTSRKVTCTGVTASAALISTGDGNDSVNVVPPITSIVNTGVGDAIVRTGSGNDSITTGDGDANVNSGGGNDSVTLGNGTNVVGTGTGNDNVTGGTGKDHVYLNDGDDIARTGAGDDIVVMGSGEDLVEAGEGNDTVDGQSPGADRVYGQGGDDYLRAGDTGEPTTVVDYVDGGSGNDFLQSDYSAHQYVGGPGIDTVSYANHSTGVTAQIGTATGNGLVGRDAIASDIERLVGGSFVDTLIGSDNADILSGGGGNDRVDGRGGNDILDEDLDVDAAGEFGDDELIGGSGADIVDYSRPVSEEWGENAGAVLDVRLDGIRNDGATALGENDLISADVEGVYGGDRNDTLRAGTAAAVLDGGKGSDTLVGGPLADSIYAQDAGGVDAVTCGADNDYVRRDGGDTVAADCEVPSQLPVVRITGSEPADGFTNDRQPAVTFVAGAGPDVTFTCQVAPIGGPFPAPVPCVSGWRPPAPLTDGEYAFIVKGKLPTTNSTTALRFFNVDGTAPDTSLVSGGSGTIAVEETAVTFGSSESDVTYECSLDTTKWRSCATTETFANLVNGSHTLRARARDKAGNYDESPLQSDFLVAVPGPQTTFVQKPTSPTSSTSATFEYTASIAGSTFECKLDSGAWAACTTPKTLTGLTSGSHTFSVRGVSAGVADPTPAVHTWTVDTALAPQTTVVGPPSNYVNTPTVTFTMTADQPGSTFECMLDETWSPCSSPWTTPAQATGASLFVRIRAKSPSGAVDESPYMRIVYFDLVAPETAITGGPAAGGTVADDQAEFTFSSADASAKFECKRDAATWETCTSPFTWTALAPGSHTFSVRALDRSGNVDGSPETRAFTATAPVAPQTSWVDVIPTGSQISDLTPTMRFTADQTRGVRFECAVGPTIPNATFVPCKSPWTVPERTSGAWSVIQVRAIGATGLVDTSPAIVAYLFDTAPPETTISTGPAAGSTIPTTATSFEFGSSESSSTFECKLDAAAWASCSSPYSATGLTTGAHTFSVRATDQAKNTDQTPATRSFTVTPSQLLTVGDPVAAPTTAALTSDATLGNAVDWVHWNGLAPANVDRKSGTAVLPTWTAYAGNVGTLSLLTGPTTFSWTNATGSAASGSAASGVANTGNGRGFTLAIPASNAATRKLKLWLGVRGATTTGGLRVNFNGQTQILKQFAGNSNTTVLNRTVTIDYRALSASDTLTVSWYQGGGPTGSPSNVVLYAAALY